MDGQVPVGLPPEAESHRSAQDPLVPRELAAGPVHLHPEPTEDLDLLLELVNNPPARHRLLPDRAAPPEVQTAARTEHPVQADGPVHQELPQEPENPHAMDPVNPAPVQRAADATLRLPDKNRAVSLHRMLTK